MDNAVTTQSPLSPPNVKKSNREGFYTQDEVAKIIGVTTKAVRLWRQKGIFVEDLRDHNGVFLYSIERVTQLKEVYHKDWTLGGYAVQDSWLADYQARFKPAITAADIAAIRNLPSEEIDELKAKIFLPANKSGYVCPFCGDGSGRDGDGIKPRTAVDGYVYHCFKSADCEGDLLRIIATANNLSLKHDFHKILAVGKKIVETAYSGNFDDITVAPPSGIASDDDDTDTLFHIQDDIFRYSKTAAQIPESERRGLTLDTLNFVQAFWYENWIHPKYRDAPNYKIPPSRRIIFPASKERYVAVIAPSDRDKIDVRFKNIHAGKEKYLYHIFDKNVCKPPANLTHYPFFKPPIINIWWEQRAARLSTN